jgi:C_GCAxxG_C_C family probable redox protein
MTKNMRKRAIESFRAGLNCTQAVVTSYSGELNFDKDLGLQIACGFGGGMGRLQETCGAVTGSFMVLGIYTCAKFAENSRRKEETYSMIQKFDEKFKQLHGTTNCHSLLNCDLRTEEGHRYAKENNLFETICEKCITDSMEIIDGLIEK